MIDPNARKGQQGQPERPDVDVIEELSWSEDASATTGAASSLEETAPDAGILEGPGIDIDLEDFEAFNRELDAQMREAAARDGNVEVIEDLGTDVIAASPRTEPPEEDNLHDTIAESARQTHPADERPGLAEDVVTIGLAKPGEPQAAAKDNVQHVERIKHAVAQARRQRESGVPSPPSDEEQALPEPPPPAHARKGGSIGVIIGLAGLLAGGAALWLTLERQADLERINATLAMRTESAAVEQVAAVDSSGAEALRALAARMDLMRERIAALEASRTKVAAGGLPTEQLDQRLAELEAEMAEFRSTSLPTPAQSDQATVAESSAKQQAGGDRTSPSPAESSLAVAEKEPPLAETPPPVEEPQRAKADGAKVRQPEEVTPTPAVPEVAKQAVETPPQPKTPDAVGETAARPEPKLAAATTPTPAAPSAAVAKSDAVGAKKATPAEEPAAPKGGEAKPAQPVAAAPATAKPGTAKQPLPRPTGGPWVVVLQSFSDEAAAERRRAEAEELGVPAEVRWAQVKGQIWHRVIVPGYPSQESARTAAAELGRRKLGSPWILLSNTPD